MYTDADIEKAIKKHPLPWSVTQQRTKKTSRTFELMDSDSNLVLVVDEFINPEAEAIAEFLCDLVNQHFIKPFAPIRSFKISE